MHKTWNQVPPLRKDFQQMEQIFQIMSINLTATFDCWGWWRWHVRNLITDRHAVSALERLSHHISVISISTSKPSRSSTGTFLALGESISRRRLLSAQSAAEAFFLPYQVSHKAEHVNIRVERRHRGNERSRRVRDVDVYVSKFRSIFGYNWLSNPFFRLHHRCRWSPPLIPPSKNA